MKARQTGPLGPVTLMIGAVGLLLAAMSAYAAPSAASAERRADDAGLRSTDRGWSWRQEVPPTAEPMGGMAGQPARAQAEVPSGTSLLIVTQISLTTNDLVFDPTRGQIYASVPSKGGSNANSVVSISFPTGTIGTPIAVGSEPNKLAISDDGAYLYVGLDGPGDVRRVNLISQTAELQFSLGTTFAGNMLVEDMFVLPGNPHALAVSRRNRDWTPRHEGVAIYDDAVQRSVATLGHTGSNVIEPGDLGSVIYGYNNESTEYGFRVMSVSSSGVEITSTTQGLISTWGADLRSSNGLVYVTTGTVIDPNALATVGGYAAGGLVYPDSVGGRVYFVGIPYLSPAQLDVFDQATYAHIATRIILGVHGKPTSLVGAGPNRLAFRTSEGQVFLLYLAELNQAAYLPVVRK
jgi:DNA-binding beta-propeller fold protein YncE